MKALQQAARAALERSYAGQSAADAAPLERMTIDVAGLNGHELVSLRTSGDVLSWSCTCGQPRCEHAHAALSMLADPAAPAATAQTPTSRSSTPPSPSRSSEPPPARREVSSDRLGAVVVERRTLPAAEPRAGVDCAALAEAVDDLLLSIARSGVNAGRSASVGDALARLRQSAPVPIPLVLERWIGRLEHALATNDAAEVALLLAGASYLADALRAPEPVSDAQQTRIRAWLGAATAHDGARLTDRSLLEIAREQLAGATRSAIERRHLIDVDSGQVYREERVAGGDPTSLGPCPRLLNVSLATLEDGPPPARVHVLQYTATLAIETGVWERLAEHAERDFSALAERYRTEVTPYPGLSEPFALVAPASRTNDALLDAAGHALAVGTADTPVMRALAAVYDELVWLCGRLHDRNGTLAMVPAGAAVRREGRVYYVQL